MPYCFPPRMLFLYRMSTFFCFANFWVNKVKWTYTHSITVGRRLTEYEPSRLSIQVFRNSAKTPVMGKIKLRIRRSLTAVVNAQNDTTITANSTYTIFNRKR